MKRCNESGSVLTMLLIGVALAAALSYATYGLLNGPVRSAAIVTMKTKAQADMILAVKLIARSSTNRDTDGALEPPDSIAISPALTGGGAIPTTIGSTKIDPWKTPFGYCAWNHGDNTNAAIGTVLAGFPGADVTIYGSKITIAVISAGPDRVFQSTCAADPTYVTVGGDDFVQMATFEDAASSGGLWKKDAAGLSSIDNTDNVLIGNVAVPGTEKLQVAGDGKISGNLEATGGINNTPIGQSVAANGAFTNLVASTSVNLYGSGTINDISIGATTPASGSFTTLATTSTALVTNLNADQLDGQHGSYYQNATNINAGTLDPNRLAALTGDLTLTRVDASNMTASIVGLRGYPVTAPVPVTDVGKGLIWDGTNWTLAGLGGDVTGALSANTVVGLRGRSVGNTAPGNKQVLAWDAGTTSWLPMTINAAGGAGNVPIVGINFLATDTNINSAACSTGQIPKYNGTNWVCAVDNDTLLTLPINADIAPSNKRIISQNTDTHPLLGFYGSRNTYLGYDAGLGLESSSGAENVFVGTDAGKSNSTGTDNVYIGDYAGSTMTTGGGNTAVGRAAKAFGSGTVTGNTYVGNNSGYDAAGNYNSGLGHSALAHSSGSNNTALGYTAASSSGLSSGSGVYIGDQAGLSRQTGDGNTMVGSRAGAYSNGGGENVFVGRDAGVLAGGMTSSVFVGGNAGYNTSGSYNTFLGQGAGASVTSGANSILIGYAAGMDNNAYRTIAIGESANGGGSLNISIGAYSKATGNNAVVLGYQAGIYQYSDASILIGAYAGYQAGGSTNTLIGVNSGRLVYGNYNVFLGSNTGRNTTSASHNVFVGNDAGNNNVDGARNVFVGANAGLNNTSGIESVLIGTNAGVAQSTGGRNVFIGQGAGGSNTSGYYNVVVGAEANSGGGATYSVAMGAGASLGWTNRNVSIGSYTGIGLGSGESNTLIGTGAGGTGNPTYSTIIGRSAGSDLVSGSANVIIGNNTTGLQTASRSIVIGPWVAAPNASEYLTIGNDTSGSVLYGSMVSGNLTVKGTLTAPSDRRLKHDIKAIEPASALEKIEQLKGVTYRWKPEYKKDNRVYLGLIAQEVQKVVPEVVFPVLNRNKLVDGKMLTVSYEQLVPMVIEAIKELKSKIDHIFGDLIDINKKLEAEKVKNVQQQQEIDTLKERLEKLEKSVSEHKK